MGHHGLKTRNKKNRFGIPCGPESFLKRSDFFRTRCTLLTHFDPHLFGLPIVACRSALGLGTGMSVSIRAILRDGGHQRWVVAGGLGVLELMF